MEINKLSEKMELNQDSIETIKEYIEDTEDTDMWEIDLKFLTTFNEINAEFEMQKTLDKYNDKNYDLVSILENVKKGIIKKLNIKITNQKHLYFNIVNAKNFNQILNSIVFNSRIYHSIGIVNAQFLNQIPDEILIENKIFINKNNVTTVTGRSILINCKSVHKSNSLTYHFGNSESEHYDLCESHHLDNSTSTHRDNCRSMHFDSSVSTHYDNCKSYHFGNAQQNGVKLSL